MRIDEAQGEGNASTIHAVLYLGRSTVAQLSRAAVPECSHATVLRTPYIRTYYVLLGAINPTQATAYAVRIRSFGSKPSAGCATHHIRGRSVENSTARRTARLEGTIVLFMDPSRPFFSEPYAPDRMLQLEVIVKTCRNTPSSLSGKQWTAAPPPHRHPCSFEVTFLCLYPGPCNTSCPLSPGLSQGEASHALPPGQWPNVHPRRLSPANHRPEHHIAEPHCSFMPSLSSSCPAAAN